jgi:hypothetical protein
MAAIKIGKIIIGTQNSGPGKPAQNSVVVVRDTKKTGVQGGKSVRKKS